MKTIRILHSSDGDWEGLYVDGHLVAEGHSLMIEDVVRGVIPEADIASVWDAFFGDKCPLSWSDSLEKKISK